MNKVTAFICKIIKQLSEKLLDGKNRTIPIYEDITEIKGIGDKTFDKWGNKIMTNKIEIYGNTDASHVFKIVDETPGCNHTDFNGDQMEVLQELIEHGKVVAQYYGNMVYYYTSLSIRYKNATGDEPMPSCCEEWPEEIIKW